MLVPMSSVKAANSPREIEETIPINVFKPRILRAGDVDRRSVGKPARDRDIATAG
jgi:hypothetical protein